jgi:hypothetical protein
MRLPLRKAKWLARLEGGSCSPPKRDDGTYGPTYLVGTYTKVRLWEGQTQWRRESSYQAPCIGAFA